MFGFLENIIPDQGYDFQPYGDLDGFSRSAEVNPNRKILFGLLILFLLRIIIVNFLITL